MRTLVFGSSLLALLFLSACGGGNAAVGTYVPDFSGVTAGMPPEQAKMMNDMMKVELTLKADNTFAMNGTVMSQPHSSSGTYSLSGDKLTVKTLEEDGKKKDPPEEAVATFKDGSITMNEGGKQVVFKKK